MNLSAFEKKSLFFSCSLIVLTFFFFDWAQGIWLIIGVPFALFFFPLQNLRMDAYFLMHKSDFHQIVEWVSTHIENGGVELSQDDSYKEVTLPEEYQDVIPEGKIMLWDKNNTLIIYIPIGYNSDSVFVSSSSFVYNSAGYSAQFCERQLNDNWSFCR